MNDSNINDGGPAFPITEYGLQGYNGMSLRAHFAGQALSGIMANPSIIAPRPDCGWGPCNCSFDDLVDLAIRQSDALIQKLKSPATP